MGDGEPGGETAGRFLPATTEATDAFEGDAGGTVEETLRAVGGVACGV